MSKTKASKAKHHAHGIVQYMPTSEVKGGLVGTRAVLTVNVADIFADWVELDIEVTVGGELLSRHIGMRVGKHEALTIDFRKPRDETDDRSERKIP